MTPGSPDLDRSGARYTFTVFTPTYNRAHTLHRVYESLQAQTFRDFEWIVVDDGSTDDTRQLVDSWKGQLDRPIRYFYQPNQGKHVAFNRGVQEAEGELFLTIDSDDGCVPTALARLKHHWDNIPAGERETFSAVTALCMDQHGRRVGSLFPSDITDSDSIEIRYRYRVTGEKWGFQRTVVLRRFPFPVIPGTTFVPEATVWKAIARQFKTRYVNEILSVYYSDATGASDQLRAAHPSRKAVGRALWYQSTLNADIGWFRWAPDRFVWYGLSYTRFSLHAGIGFLDQVRKLDNALAKTLWATMLPAGCTIYLLDTLHSRRAHA